MHGVVLPNQVQDDGSTRPAGKARIGLAADEVVEECVITLSAGGQRIRCVYLSLA